MVDGKGNFGFGETLSTMEAATIVRLTPEALYQRMRAGKLTPVNPGGATSGFGHGYRWRITDIRKIHAERVLQDRRRAQRAAAKARVARAQCRLAEARLALRSAGQAASDTVAAGVAS